MGVAGIYQILQSRIRKRLSAILAAGISLLAVPVLMAVENWDDHDRSNKYTARDIARNYLNSCDQDAILYTVGDNDTFPLWYVQDVEGVREDVRIVNMMLLNMHWYIEQMRWQNYDSEPLPFTLPQSKYDLGINNSLYVREHERWATFDYMLTFVKSDDPRTKIPLRNRQQVDYIPTHKLVLPVDSAKVISSGTVAPYEADSIVGEIRLQLTPNDQIMKGGMAQLDIFGTNQWERPIYYTSGGFEGSLGLEEYYRLEGLAYRVVPIHASYESIIEMGSVDTDTLYDRLMNTYTWGGMEERDVLLDYYTIRTLSVIRFRNIHTRLALRLLGEGEQKKAVEVLDYCMELAPSRVVPYDQYITGITIPDREGGIIHHPGIIEAYYLCGEMEKGNRILTEYYRNLAHEYNYYNSMKPRHKTSIQSTINEVIFQIEEMKLLLQNYGQDELMMELGMTGESLLPFSR
jgi:hypothetical protein